MGRSGRRRDGAAGSSRARRPRSTSSAPSTSGTSSRARSSSSRRARRRGRSGSPPARPRAVRLRADLLRPARLVHGGPQPLRGAAADGRGAGRRAPVETDLVMPVPDTGAPAAAGYAEASGIPYREGMVRNRYTGRTFIQPSQTMRHRGVTLKLNPLREVVRGKRLTVVDDSIVRGHDDEADRGAAAAGRRRGGPRPDQRAADLPPLLLRDRHPGRDRADRRDPHRRGDPRLHRRRLARLPLDPGRPRRARPAVRPLLLRLLRRRLPGARPVRHGVAEVPARRGRRPSASAVAETRAGLRARPASTSPPASGRSS